MRDGDFTTAIHVLGSSLLQMYLDFTYMRGYNPVRRNRNIGTAKSGHGQNNRMAIPQIARGEREFWELAQGTQRICRIVSGRSLTFFVQQTRKDCVHACTVDDITNVMSHVPDSDWTGLDAIFLRQPSRKEQVMAPVWGRLAYAADIINERNQILYSGPAIILEAINPTEPFKFGKRLSPEGSEEIERLISDGHKLRPGDKANTFDMSLESCRATQLYRTLLHELGHWADFLEKVERPASALSDGSDVYPDLLEKYHRRPKREREQYAHKYAENLRLRLVKTRVIPFSRQLDCERLESEKLRLTDFTLS